MILNIILIGVIVLQQIIHYKVVKDLTLKIMSKDVFEYKSTIEKPEPPKPEIPVISPEEADAKEYLESLEKLNKENNG